MDAVKELAQKAGVQINFDKTDTSYKKDNLYKILEISSEWFQENLNVKGNICKDYLESRSINLETIKNFKLGYSFNPKSSLYDYLKSHSFQVS